MAGILATPPPDIEHSSYADLWSLAKMGRRFRGLGKKDGYRLLRWAPMSASDFLSEWFESEPLRAALAGPGIFGTTARSTLGGQHGRFAAPAGAWGWNTTTRTGRPWGVHVCIGISRSGCGRRDPAERWRHARECQGWPRQRCGSRKRRRAAGEGCRVERGSAPDVARSRGSGPSRARIHGSHPQLPVEREPLRRSTSR